MRAFQTNSYNGNNFYETKTINNSTINNIYLAYTSSLGIAENRANDASVPVVYGDVIYKHSGNWIYAININDGSTLWKKKYNNISLAGRGITHLKVGSQEIIFVPSSDGIIALDATSGEVYKTLGTNGLIEVGKTNVPPIFYSGSLIIATMTGKVVRYDLWSNKIVWEKNFKSFEAEIRFWQNFSFNKEKQIILLSTSNPGGVVDLYRSGLEDFGSSLIGLKFETGDLVFQSQDVYNDVWDFDMSGPPITFKTAGGVNIAVGLAKTGNVHVINLENYDYVFSNPTYIDFDGLNNSRINSRIAYFKLPSRVSDYVFSKNKYPKRINDCDEIRLRHVERGSFHKPSIDKNLLLQGVHGGASWPGGAINTVTNTLYVPVNLVPYQMALDVELPQNFPKKSNLTTKALSGLKDFNMFCKSCHSNGIGPVRESTKFSGVYIPGLIGYENRLGYEKPFPEYLNYVHSCDQTYNNISDVQAKNIKVLLDEVSFEKNNNLIGRWSFFSKSTDSLPFMDSSWGEIAVIDLNTGVLINRFPNGSRDIGNGKKHKGDIAFAGIALTANGLILSTGTPNPSLEIYSAKNGKILHQVNLPNSATTKPIIHTDYNGCETILVITGPGKYWGYQMDDKLIKLNAYKTHNCK